MKRKTKILAILAGIVCIILAAVLTLSLIIIRPIERMGDYAPDKIRIMDSYGIEQQRNDEVLQKAFGTVKFSVMRSLLEFSAGYKIKQLTMTDADGDTVPVYLTAEQFKSLRPVNGEFMIKLSYDSPFVTNKRFVDENGNEIKYDTVVVIIPKSGNTITDVKIYPYLDYNLDNQNWELDDYDEQGRIGMQYAKVYEFKAKMYTYKMYDILDDEFKSGAATDSTTE